MRTDTYWYMCPIILFCKYIAVNIEVGAEKNWLEMCRRQSSKYLIIIIKNDNNYYIIKNKKNKKNIATILV